MDIFLFLDIMGTGIGLVYLWLEYHAKRSLWLVSMIMPSIDIFLYYKKGLYADFGMAIYYLLIAIYGWIVWNFQQKRKGKPINSRKSVRPIIKTPTWQIPILIIASATIWGLLYFVLSKTNSTVPIVDSLANALSIVAMWMLARKYLEQWIVWFVADAIICGLYIYKGIPFHGILYGFYTVVAILGYRKWQRSFLLPQQPLQQHTR